MSTPIVNDGTLQFGSRVLAITPPAGGSPVSFIADDYSVNSAGAVTKAYDEDNAPRGSVMTREFKEGSATLQFQTSAASAPALGSTFTEDAVTYYLTSVGDARVANGLGKISVQFLERIITPA